MQVASFVEPSSTKASAELNASVTNPWTVKRRVMLLNMLGSSSITDIILGCAPISVARSIPEIFGFRFNLRISGLAAGNHIVSWCYNAKDLPGERGFFVRNVTQRRS